MAGNQGGEVPAPQDEANSGDAHVAGYGLAARCSQVEVSGSQGVLVGDGGTQVNNYNYFASSDPGVQQAGGSVAAVPAGRPLAEVNDPFDLEVHRPVQADGPPAGPGLLPTYVARGLDRLLAKVVQAAAEGKSGIAVLAGGSSTGKTRACWEALRLLREQPQPWRLWHPISPSRPEAAREELDRIGPRTVVWLNEAQFYLLTGDGTGEQVAAGLRELLRDPARTPVLVLATLWPEYWARLTVQPAAGAPDPHAESRELLAGRQVQVPSELTAAERDWAAGTGDPQLALAVRQAGNGRVIQFLAGAPELVSRYEGAPPAARALLDAAADARRLGMGPELPLAFLEAATPGYLDDTDQDTLPPDWLEKALAYAAAPCKGVRGPLAPIRPAPASRRGLPPTASPTTWSSTAASPAVPSYPRMTSGTRQPATPAPATCPPSRPRPTTAACSATQPSSASTPPDTATSTRHPPSSATCTPSTRTQSATEQRSGQPPTPPWMTRAMSPPCCTHCRGRGQPGRSPRWPTAPPPAYLSTTRLPSRI